MDATSNPQSTKVATAAGEPLKEQVKRGMDELRKAN